VPALAADLEDYFQLYNYDGRIKAWAT